MTEKSLEFRESITRSTNSEVSSPAVHCEGKRVTLLIYLHNLVRRNVLMRLDRNYDDGLWFYQDL